MPTALRGHVLNGSSMPTPSRGNGAWERLFALAILSMATFPGCATFRGRKDPAEAVGECRQLSREGVVALEHGDAARARLLLEQAVATSPTDVDARRNLAEALWRDNEPSGAVEQIERAAELDPRHVATIVRAGEMLLGVRDVDRAQLRADEALVLDSTQAGAWALRGRVYRQRGDSERALADFHQALRYNPRAADVLLEAAQLQYELGRPQRCLTTLQNLLDLYPEDQQPRPALWLEGLAFAAVDRKQDAVDSLYAATTQGAPDPELLYQLARAQNDIGQTAAAAPTARQAADAGHVGSQSLLAQILGAGGGETILR
jgi:tetratricopeptide (TPR) repeat protein